MSRESIVIEKRDATGKSPVARRLRRSGRVPGVLYHGDGNISFSADALEMAALVRHGATLVDATLEGDTHLSVMKEVQRHPVRGEITHVDLQVVRLDEKVRTLVSLTLVGTAPGQKEGGVLTQGTRDVHVECVASAIPEDLPVDISDMHVGDTMLLQDIEVPEGVTILDDPGQLVISITVPRGAKGAKAGDEGEGDAEAAGDGAAADDAGDASATEG